MQLNRSVVAWVLVGLTLAVVLAVTFVAFAGTILFGLFIYYATRPVYDRLLGRLGNRALAAAASLLSLALPIVFLLGYTVLVGLQEFRRFTQNNDLGEFESYVEPYLGASSSVTNPEEILANPGTFLADPSISRFAEEAFGQVLGYLGLLGTAALKLFVMIVVAYYLLKDGRRLSRWVLGKFDDDRGVMAEFFRAVDRDFQNVFFGNILNAFLTAILAAIVYSVMNAHVAPAGIRIPYPVLAGLLMAVGSLIPVVGILVVYVPVGAFLTITAYSTDPALLWFPALFFIVSFVVIGALPDFVLRPYVAAGSLHVGAVMLAYTFGPLLFGWYGIFLGPVLLVLITHFGRIVVPELLDDRTLGPYAIDPTYMEVSDPSAGRSADTASVAVDGGPDRGGGAAETPPAEADERRPSGDEPPEVEDGEDHERESSRNDDGGDATGPDERR